jgi:hypothetical protein
MKTALAILGLTALLTSPLYGGAEAIIKERAKEVVNQNNVRQGVASPAESGSAATPAAPSAAITRLSADIAALKAETTVEQKLKLASDLILAAETAGKPTPASVRKLAEDLASACAQKALPSASRTRLVTELDAVLNPPRYPSAKLDGIYADIQAIFQANGLTRNPAVQISKDVKTIAAEVRK